MSQLNLSQVRIIDPVLTSIAQGYKQSELIGSGLFPLVPVGQRAGMIVAKVMVRGIRGAGCSRSQRVIREYRIIHRSPAQAPPFGEAGGGR